MARDLSNPLQALIAGAAKSLPATTGLTARAQARLDGAGRGVVILCDTSSSMEERAGRRSKIAILREALQDLDGDLPDAQLVAFGSTAREIRSAAELPAPAGGTALHAALELAGRLRPAKTLVISDGRPDDERRALDAAELLPGIIDVIYCGPDGDAQAIAFMRRLATAGGGRVIIRDVVRMSSPSLVRDTRAALGLPAPKGR